MSRPSFLSHLHLLLIDIIVLFYYYSIFEGNMMSSPIVIPESISLAVHALARLACCNEGTVSLENLLIKPGSSDHLSKVMQRLSKAGIVGSRRGRGGGFFLKVDPRDIRLMDIWIVMEGSFGSGTCPYRCGGCALSSCIFGSMVEDALIPIREYLESTTVADLGKLLKDSAENSQAVEDA